MRIGIDFDNTIVSYDKLFHKVALEQGVIHENIPVNKIAVRDYLRSVDKEHIWTEMQGYVYGARMAEANSYPDVIEVMQKLKNAGYTLAIVSHKTKHPYLGKQYDLHQAARGWIEQSLLIDGDYLIPKENIFFEVTKEDKLKRIANFGCDIFLDDLPEILLANLFPDKTKRFLFDPEKNHNAEIYPTLTIVPTWTEFLNVAASETFFSLAENGKTSTSEPHFSSAENGKTSASEPHFTSAENGKTSASEPLLPSGEKGRDEGNIKC